MVTGCTSSSSTKSLNVMHILLVDSLSDIEFLFVLRGLISFMNQNNIDSSHCYYRRVIKWLKIMQSIHL